MKKWISNKIDIEIYRDFSFAKNIVVMFMGVKIAKFKIENGSTEIKKLKI